VKLYLVGSIKPDKTDMKSKLIIQLLIFTGMAFTTVMSCTYNEVLPVGLDPNKEIFFSQDIIPIFENSCISSGCHNGTVSPDLRSASAYESLETGGYLNTEVPDQSELYLWMTEAKGPMPPLGANETDNATVLQWITQGAKNN
jgi:hypothetical protein